MTRSQFIDKWTKILHELQVMPSDLKQMFVDLRSEMSQDMKNMDEFSGREYERGKRAGAIPALEKYITELHRLAEEFRKLQQEQFINWNVLGIPKNHPLQVVSISAHQLRDFKAGHRLLVVLAAAHLGVDPDQLSLSDFMGHAEKIYGQLRAAVDAEKKEEEGR